MTATSVSSSHTVRESPDSSSSAAHTSIHSLIFHLVSNNLLQILLRNCRRPGESRYDDRNGICSIHAGLKLRLVRHHLRPPGRIEYQFGMDGSAGGDHREFGVQDRKSTRLNS